MRAALCLLSLSACSHSCAPQNQPDADSDAHDTVDAKPAAFAPTRCSPAADAIPFDKLGMGEVTGDLVSADNHVYVASIKNGFASVGIGSAALNHLEWTPLGPTLGDAPPPELIATSDRTYALHWERADASTARSIAVTMIRPSIKRVWSILENDLGESFAIDAAFAGPRGLLAWDTSHGVRVAALKEATDPTPHALSPPGVFASAPRVIRRSSDYVVVWSERKIDAFADGAPRTQPGESIEAPGEARAYEWLSFAALDDDAAAKGATHRITSESGHIGRFDVALNDDDSIDVYGTEEVDDTTHEDIGGRVLRVTIRGDHADAPVPIISSGVGRGEPSIVRSTQGSWLFYEDTIGGSRALPLGLAGVPLGLPSLEPALADVRLATPPNDSNVWLGVSTASIARVHCSISENPVDGGFNGSFQTNGVGH